MCAAKAEETGRRMKVLYTSDFKKHRAPPGMSHPECPQRLDACVKALKESDEIGRLVDWCEPKQISGEEEEAVQRRNLVMEYVNKVHEENYLNEVERISKKGGAMDSDTYVAPGSWDIALRAASTWMESVEMAVEGGERVVWALCRPPGHHATRKRGMGFCLLSNAAIAALYALQFSEVDRVGIVDYDVHHGNGTEDAVKGAIGIRFVSSHQCPLFPGSGMEGEVGNVKNLALDAGMAGEEYLERFENEMLPFLCEEGKPDLVIVSAGFDALDVDPLAGLQFTPPDYRRFTEIMLREMGAGCKFVFGLEGGYDLGEKGVGAGVRESIMGYCLREPEAIPELADTDAPVLP